MNFKPVELRPSAGQGKPKSDIPKALKDYCTEMTKKLPPAAFHTDYKEINYGQLLGAMYQAIEANNDFTMEWGDPTMHEVSGGDPGQWTGDNGDGLVFSGTYQTKTVYVGIAYKP